MRTTSPVAVSTSLRKLFLRIRGRHSSGLQLKSCKYIAYSLGNGRSDHTHGSRRIAHLSLKAQLQRAPRIQGRLISETFTAGDPELPPESWHAAGARSVRYTTSTPNRHRRRHRRGEISHSVKRKTGVLFLIAFTMPPAPRGQPGPDMFRESIAGEARRCLRLGPSIDDSAPQEPGEHPVPDVRYRTAWRC